MGIFGSPPRKRRSKQVILNALKRRLAKKQRTIDKKKKNIKLSNEIVAARKKLRGY